MRFRAKMVGVALSRRRMLFLKKILFTYLAAWHLSHGTQSLHCVMQDSSLQCKGSLVVVKGLQSTGSAAAAHGLSCSASLTRDGTCTPILQDRFLTTGPPGKSQGCFLSLRWIKGVENKWGSPELWGEEKGSQVGWYLTCCWDHLPGSWGAGLTKPLANQTLVKGLDLSCCASSISSLTVNHHSSHRS